MRCRITIDSMLCSSVRLSGTLSEIINAACYFRQVTLLAKDRLTLFAVGFSQLSHAQRIDLDTEKCDFM